MGEPWSPTDTSSPRLTAPWTSTRRRMLASLQDHCLTGMPDFSFLSRQFTVRVGEWNLADNDNYSEELQVNIVLIQQEFINANVLHSL